MLVTNVNLSTEMSSVSGYNKGLNTTGTRSRGKSEIKQDNFVATSTLVNVYVVLVVFTRIAGTS